MNPRRFRFSLATHMAEEGASLFDIAEVLHHSDTQNARVYIETASSIAGTVAKATDSALAPLVHRFQGAVIDSDGHLPTPVIRIRSLPQPFPIWGFRSSMWVASAGAVATLTETDSANCFYL